MRSASVDSAGISSTLSTCRVSLFCPTIDKYSVFLDVLGKPSTAPSRFLDTGTRHLAEWRTMARSVEWRRHPWLFIAHYNTVERFENCPANRGIGSCDWDADKIARSHRLQFIKSRHDWDTSASPRLREHSAAERDVQTNARSSKKNKRRKNREERDLGDPECEPESEISRATDCSPDFILPTFPQKRI